MERPWFDLEAELSAMPEWKTLWRIRTFARAIRLLDRNGQELLGLLRFMTEDPRSWHLAEITKRAIRQALMEEVGRLLHNFVAAALTLVDHSRRLQNEMYASAVRFPDLRGEIDRRFTKNPLIQFVHGLRHFTLHRSLPNIRFSTAFAQGTGVTRTIQLTKADLLQSHHWNAAAKAYLEAASETINVAGVVSGYLDGVRSFYSWMAWRQAEIHRDEIAAVSLKQAELYQAMAPDVPQMLRSNLRSYAEGMGRFQDVFYHLLSPEDWIDLSVHEGRLLEWANAALKIVVNRFGDLPPELVEEIQAATKSRTDQGDVPGPVEI